MSFPHALVQRQQQFNEELMAKPQKSRSVMDLKTFWSIYRNAGQRGYHGLQNAMLISLITTLREGDILTMTFDQTDGDTLRVVVGKSEKQRGAASATRLEWHLCEYPILREVIDRARASSSSHHRCPFIVHYKGKRVNPSKQKRHRFQMLKRQLTDQFAQCRPDIPSPTTFHEIRALSSVIFRKKGYQLPSIQELMAHSDEATTLGYQDYGDLPFIKVALYLTEKDIEGEI